MRLVFMICFQNRFRMQLKLWLRTVSVAQFVFLPTSRYCKYTPIFVPLQPILNIQTENEVTICLCACTFALVFIDNGECMGIVFPFS